MTELPCRSQFIHEIQVRYGECDMQGVVFNPNYLVFADDVVDHWFIERLGRDWAQRFDCAVKKSSLEWHSAARHGDRVRFEVRVPRWGNTSFTVVQEASVDGRPVVTIEMLYISVRPGSHEPVPVPPEVREALGRAI